MRILFDQGTPPAEEPSDWPYCRISSRLELVPTSKWSVARSSRTERLSSICDYGSKSSVSTAVGWAKTGSRGAVVNVLPQMQPHLSRIEQVIAGVHPGQYVEVPI